MARAYATFFAHTISLTKVTRSNFGGQKVRLNHTVTWNLSIENWIRCIIKMFSSDSYTTMKVKYYSYPAWWEGWNRTTKGLRRLDVAVGNKEVWIRELVNGAKIGIVMRTKMNWKSWFCSLHWHQWLEMPVPVEENESDSPVADVAFAVSTRLVE